MISQVTQRCESIEDLTDSRVPDSFTVNVTRKDDKAVDLSEFRMLMP